VAACEPYPRVAGTRWLVGRSGMRSRWWGDPPKATRSGFPSTAGTASGARSRKAPCGRELPKYQKKVDFVCRRTVGAAETHVTGSRRIEPALWYSPCTFVQTEIDFLRFNVT